MKKIILILTIFFSIACRAQKPVASLNVEKIKLAKASYFLNKTSTEKNSYTSIVNAANKLTHVKQVAPNVPNGVILNQYKKTNEQILVDICADVISLNVLRKMAKDYDQLSIQFKVDNMGKLLELEFLVKDNSLITAEQIFEIERRIKESNYREVFDKKIEKFLVGLNYFEFSVGIQYNAMLKAKLERK